MNQKDLIVGERYVLSGGVVAVFDGKHDGTLVLADGYTVKGFAKWLRFHHQA